MMSPRAAVKSIRKRQVVLLLLAQPAPADASSACPQAINDSKKAANAAIDIALPYSSSYRCAAATAPTAPVQ